MNDNCSHLNAGVSLPDYISSKNDDVTYKMQTLGQTKDEKLASDMSEEEVEEEEG
jgi:hypothetical protein